MRPTRSCAWMLFREQDACGAGLSPGRTVVVVGTKATDVARGNAAGAGGGGGGGEGAGADPTGATGAALAADSDSPGGPAGPSVAGDG